MKRFFALLLCCLCPLLSACSHEQTQQTTQPSAQPEQTTQSLTVQLTFPEGMTVSEMAQKLEENGVCEAASFLLSADDPEIFNAYLFGTELSGDEHRAFLGEGYIFPDTYEFYRQEEATQVLLRFLNNTENKLTQDISGRAGQMGYSLDEIMTIASIIQEEATIPEMKKVSAVLHNRLDNGMQLQCDVTIDYIENSVKPYIDGDIDRYNEYYNTYKCQGLPNGPICNPGMAAIQAALYPADTDALYFVTDKADPDIFYYAVDYETHLQNCEAAGW